MNENENNVVTDETIEIVPTQETEVVETSKGLSKGQKMAGLGVIAFAVFGIVEAVRYAIKGVKWLWGKTFGKKKTEDPKTEKKEDLQVTEVSNETMDEIEKTEEK